jgi:hypothetical protein
MAQGSPPGSEGSGLGARQFGRRQPPLFEIAPRAPVTVGPNPVCRMPVLHAAMDADPHFVVPVPKGDGVPVFAMRWAPSTPCDPARAAAAETHDRSARPRK